MRKINLKNCWGICLAAMVLCMSLTSCNKNDDKDSPKLTDYVEVTITACERVGSVLMIDYKVKNKISTNIEVYTNAVKVVDNNGSDYNAELNINDGAYNNWTETTIISGNEVVCHAKVYDFDPTNRATSINFSIGMDVNNTISGTMWCNGVEVTDNRVLTYGIQTNDRKLSYRGKSCKMVWNEEERRNDVFLEYTITNYTGMSLEDFGMGYAYGGEAKVYDGNSNSYDSSIRFGNDDWYHFGAVDRLAAGSTVQATIWIKDVKSSATELNIYIGASAKNYVCEDNTVRFLTIPIEKE